MRNGLVVAGKYRIVREIGAGGMGSVWQAVHRVTEREFAIKFLHAAGAASPSVLARFFQEAKVSGKLRHPSIIEIFDLGTAPELGGAPFLVMELLDGASLDILLRQLGKLPPRLVLEIVAEVARALALAHDKGIVHRDLKPANLFLHRPGTGAVVPKVLDFGISKIATGGAPEDASGLTQTGAVLGSPLYLSPEQAASDKTIDGRSDVHALGVVMWECLVGAPPFTPTTYNNLVVQIMTGDRPGLAQALPSAAPGVVAIVERAMARARDARFQSATDLADAIDAELATMGPVSVLTARTAAAEIFARVTHASAPPPAAPPAGTTTGGVTVPSASRIPYGPSPSAFTVEQTAQGVHTPAAYDATLPVPGAPPPAPPTPHAAAARTPASEALSASTPRKRTWPAIMAALVALAATVGTVAGVRYASSRSATPATVDVAIAPASTSAPVLPPVPAPAPASASALAPEPTPVSTPAASTPRFIPARPVAAPAMKRPRDSVESSGFR